MSNKMLDKITEMAEIRERERIANLREIENAKNQERSRIIKLLESKSECTPMRGHDWSGDCYCEVIALIKGEK